MHQPPVPPLPCRARPQHLEVRRQHQGKPPLSPVNTQNKIDFFHWPNTLFNCFVKDCTQLRNLPNTYLVWITYKYNLFKLPYFLKLHWKIFWQNRFFHTDGDDGATCTEFPCLIFEDNFDTLDQTIWEHEKTLGGGGVIIMQTKV